MRKGENRIRSKVKVQHFHGRAWEGKSIGSSQSNRWLAIAPLNDEDYESHWGIFSFRGKTILDVGADYGSTAAFFLRKGAKRVIAVESDSAYFTRLKVNFERSSRVIPVNLEIRGHTQFESLIRRFNPDLLKVDCEGCEIHLINSRPSLLRSVPEYLVETHDNIGLETRFQIEKLFNKIGYVHETYGVLPGVLIVHARRRWESIGIYENEITRLRNAAHRAEYLEKLDEALRTDPLSALLRVYAIRPDLRKAYPEVKSGNYRPILEWANNIIANRIDEHRTLSDYDSWYRDNLVILPPEKLTELRQRLDTAEEELEEIKRSLGFIIIHFWGSRLNRLFPDGTRRGNIRRMLVQGLLIAATQGVTSLLHQSRLKAKKSEFEIVEPPAKSEPPKL